MQSYFSRKSEQNENNIPNFFFTFSQQLNYEKDANKAKRITMKTQIFLRFS